uniref:Uncharacterized protein n=1 Tax=Moniliophthora roreri TaxID=221103 RepID=A0A0W0G469_MONRR
MLKNVVLYHCWSWI